MGRAYNMGRAHVLALLLLVLVLSAALGGSILLDSSPSLTLSGHFVAASEANKVGIARE